MASLFVRDYLEFDSVTLKLQFDLEIRKMYVRTKNDAGRSMRLKLAPLNRTNTQTDRRTWRVRKYYHVAFQSGINYENQHSSVSLLLLYNWTGNFMHRSGA